jgi:hypothetical protein
MKHEWQFLSARGNSDTPLVVAVCSACGLIRRTAASDGRRVDLRGDCPGEPQAPDAPKRAVIG